MEAILTDNYATQIITGAGTGKTLPLQRKVKFLIKKNIPREDILCISYSVASKEDLEKKLKKTLGNNKVKMKTFHSVRNEILKINKEKCRVKEDTLNCAIVNHLFLFFNSPIFIYCIHFYSILTVKA